MNSLKSSLGPLAAVRLCTTLISLLLLFCFSSTAYDVRVTEEFAEPASSAGLPRHSWGTRTFNPLNPNIKIQILICDPYTF